MKDGIERTMVMTSRQRAGTYAVTTPRLAFLRMICAARSAEITSRGQCAESACVTSPECPDPSLPCRPACVAVDDGCSGGKCSISKRVTVPKKTYTSTKQLHAAARTS